MQKSARRLQDPVARIPWEQMMPRSREVRQRTFLNSTQKQIKLSFTGYSKLYREC